MDINDSHRCNKTTVQEWYASKGGYNTLLEIFHINIIVYVHSVIHPVTSHYHNYKQFSMVIKKIVIRLDVVSLEIFFFLFQETLTKEKGQCVCMYVCVYYVSKSAKDRGAVDFSRVCIQLVLILLPCHLTRDSHFRAMSMQLYLLWLYVVCM